MRPVFSPGAPGRREAVIARMKLAEPASAIHRSNARQVRTCDPQTHGEEAHGSDTRNAQQHDNWGRRRYEERRRKGGETRRSAC
eukprot:5686130-Pleurochrysis_carterae.AAC.1